MMQLVVNEPRFYYDTVKHIKLEEVNHKGEERIKLIFEYDSELIERVNTLDDCRWSATMRCWHIPYREDFLGYLKNKFSDIEFIYFSHKTLVERARKVPKLDFSKNQEINKFKCYLRSKRYSDSTIGNYVNVLKHFFDYFKEKEFDEITNDDIIDFNDHFVIRQHYSRSFQNMFISAIKLFYKKQQNRNLEIDLIERPKKSRPLPVILSVQEIKELFNQLKNIKHRAIIGLIYSAGLRVGEVVKIQLDDIDSKRMILHIRNAKGSKDRIVGLSIEILKMLREYFKLYKPKKFLFESPYGESYSAGSIQSIFTRAVEKTNIRKKIKIHTLRHTYATHLLEKGTDLRYIQLLLGHKSSKTTEIYTHVALKNISNIQSPFDDLFLDHDTKE